MPQKTIEAAPGVSLIDPSTFEGHELELLRLLLSPLSTVEDDGTGKAAGLPEDVALVTARYQDAAAAVITNPTAPPRRVCLGPWAFDPLIKDRPVPKYLKPPVGEEGAPPPDPDHTQGLATTSKTFLYFHPEEGYVSFTESDQYEPLDGTFAEEMLSEYQQRVDAIARMKPAVSLSTPDTLEGHVHAAVTAISRIQTLLAIPDPLLASPLPEMVLALFAPAGADDIIAFCDSGCALGEEDARKPVLRERFRKDGLVVLWDLLIVLEKMSDDAFRTRAAPVRARLEALLDKRWVDAQGPMAVGRWRRPD